MQRLLPVCHPERHFVAQDQRQAMYPHGVSLLEESERSDTAAPANLIFLHRERRGNFCFRREFRTQ